MIRFFFVFALMFAAAVSAQTDPPPAVKGWKFTRSSMTGDMPCPTTTYSAVQSDSFPVIVEPLVSGLKSAFQAKVPQYVWYGPIIEGGPSNTYPTFTVQLTFGEIYKPSNVNGSITQYRCTYGGQAEYTCEVGKSAGSISWTDETVTTLTLGGMGGTGCVNGCSVEVKNGGCVPYDGSLQNCDGPATQTGNVCTTTSVAPLFNPTPSGSGSGSTGGGTTGGTEGGGTTGGGSTGGGTTGGGTEGDGTGGGTTTTPPGDGTGTGGTTGDGTGGTTGGTTGDGTGTGGTTGGTTGDGTGTGGTTGGTTGGGTTGGGTGTGSGVCDPTTQQCSSVGDTNQCENLPSCSGDAVQCAQMLQSWRTVCALGVIHAPGNIEGLVDIAHPEGTPDQKALAEKAKAGMDFDVFDAFQNAQKNYLNFASACPSSQTISVLGAQVHIDSSALCSFGAFVRFLVHIVAYGAVLRLMLKTTF